MGTTPGQAKVHERVDLVAAQPRTRKRQALGGRLERSFHLFETQSHPREAARLGQRRGRRGQPARPEFVKRPIKLVIRHHNLTKKGRSGESNRPDGFYDARALARAA
uniref:Uncharacterized protein n=1 Tax=Caulobacter sp. (strain K31) TaxID=366602 RepID=B0SYH5_CAUSK